MIDQQIEHYLDQFLDKDYGTETFAEWAGKLLGVEFDARDFRGMDFAGRREPRPRPGRADGRRPGAGSHRGKPARRGRCQPEWNWEALAKTVNIRWHLSLRDRDLKQVGREGVGEFLIERAREAIAKGRLRRRRPASCEPDFGVRDGLRLGAAQVRHRADAGGRSATLEPAAMQAAGAARRPRRPTTRRKSSYPVMAGLYHFTTRDSSRPQALRSRGAGRLGRRAVRRGPLAGRPQEQAAARDPGDCSWSRAGNGRPRPETALDEGQRLAGNRSSTARPPTTVPLPAATASSSRCPTGCSETSATSSRRRRSPGSIAERLETHLTARDRGAFPARKCGGWSGTWCCNCSTTAWKNHLLAMDHLRSSVGLRGYAQIDPKVEYKREGMRTFEQMWNSRRRAGDRPDLPHGAARRELRRLDLEGIGGDPRGRPVGRRDRRAAAGGHRRHRSRPQARSRSATASRAWAATIPAPAAAARSSNTAMEKAVRRKHSAPLFLPERAWFFRPEAMPLSRDLP